MTLDDLESYVKNFLQFDYGTGNWTQAEIQQYIRDEELRLFVHIDSKDEDWFSTSASISEVGGTSVYSLPTNFFKGIRVERVLGGLATQQLPVPMNVVDRNYSTIQRARGSWWPSTNPGTSTIPMHYQFHGQRSIEIFPIPVVTLTNSIIVYYSARPNGMYTSTDVPFQIASGAGGSGTDNLSEWHDIIGLGACEKALLHEEAYEQADRVKALRQERLQELTAYLAQVNKQMPRYIHVTDAAFDY